MTNQDGGAHEITKFYVGCVITDGRHRKAHSIEALVRARLLAVNRPAPPTSMKRSSSSLTRIFRRASRLSSMPTLSAEITSRQANLGRKQVLASGWPIILYEML